MVLLGRGLVVFLVLVGCGLDWCSVGLFGVGIALGWLAFLTPPQSSRYIDLDICPAGAPSRPVLCGYTQKPSFCGVSPDFVGVYGFVGFLGFRDFLVGLVSNRGCAAVLGLLFRTFTRSEKSSPPLGPHRSPVRPQLALLAQVPKGFLTHQSITER